MTKKKKTPSKSALKLREKYEKEVNAINELTKNIDIDPNKILKELELKRGTPMEKKTTQTQTRRIYKGDMEIDHDLFKLEVSTARKNVSIDNTPLYAGVEHCHFFHTYDSNGRKQAACSPIAGHTHQMEVTADDDGNLVAKAGPAVKYAGGKFIPVSGDNHTHDTTYIASEKIQVRRVSAEAQRDYDRYVAGLQNA